MLITFPAQHLANNWQSECGNKFKLVVYVKFLYFYCWIWQPQLRGLSHQKARECNRTTVPEGRDQQGSRGVSISGPRVTPWRYHLLLLHHEGPRNRLRHSPGEGQTGEIWKPVWSKQNHLKLKILLPSISRFKAVVPILPTGRDSWKRLIRLPIKKQRNYVFLCASKQCAVWVWKFWPCWRSRCLG